MACHGLGASQGRWLSKFEHCHQDSPIAVDARLFPMGSSLTCDLGATALKNKRSLEEHALPKMGSSIHIQE